MALLANAEAHPDVIGHAAEALLTILPPADALHPERSALARLLRARLTTPSA